MNFVGEIARVNGIGHILCHRLVRLAGHSIGIGAFRIVARQSRNDLKLNLDPIIGLKQSVPTHSAVRSSGVSDGVATDAYDLHLCVFGEELAD